MDKRPTSYKLHFPDLSIEGFRGLRHLSIPHLGRVTLITGKNNTGKSSILEALRLHTQNADPTVVYSILTFREEYSRRVREEDHYPDQESGFPFSALFHGFPEIWDDFEPIVISTSSRSGPVGLTIRVDWRTVETNSRENQVLAPNEAVFFDDFENIEDEPSLIVETEKEKNVWPLERYIRLLDRPRLRVSTRARMPCIFVSPYSGERTDMVGSLWDGVTLTDSEKELIKALRIIDPRISDVAVIGGEGPLRRRTAIVRASNIPRPVSLRSFGDGLNRLLAIVLSLLNAGGGLLLVDEFENGLHYTVQLDAWRIIFRLAQTLDVQVFATSHSWDAIEAFQEAASETPEDGVLLRLTRRGDDVIPTVFTERELAIATRDDIELR